MNNYYSYQDYYNQMKKDSSYNNQTMINKDQAKFQTQEKQLMNNITNVGLYNPYQGFIRGNLFTGLYDPYLSGEPYEIKPMNKQAELLTNIDSLGFAMIDLNLYLDVYPNDRQMIELYNQYRKQKQELKDQYESEYGPLSTNSKSLDVTPWAWNDKPWPWQ